MRRCAWGRHCPFTGRRLRAGARARPAEPHRARRPADAGGGDAGGDAGGDGSSSYSEDDARDGAAGGAQPPAEGARVLALGADVVYQPWQHGSLLSTLAACREATLPGTEGAAAGGGSPRFVALLAIADRGGGRLESFLRAAQGPRWGFQVRALATDGIIIHDYITISSIITITIINNIIIMTTGARRSAWRRRGAAVSPPTRAPSHS